METIRWGIIFMLALLLPNEANACSCVGIDDSQDLLKLSDAVFVGKVVSSNKQESVIDIAKTYKGTLPKQLKVVVRKYGTNCDMTPDEFTSGKSYLFGSSSSAISGKNLFAPHRCATMIEYESTSALVKWLDNGGLREKKAASPLDVKPSPTP